MFSGGQIQMKGSALLDMETVTDQGIPMVTALEVGLPEQVDHARPSLVLRRIEEGGLWNMAKQTGSTVSAIRQANQLSGEPTEGQMLLIPVG